MTKPTLPTLWIGAAIIASCAVFSETAHAQAQPDWQEDIDRIAEREMRRTGIPSLQIAIGYDGEVVFERAYGFADVERQISATTKTLYRTASISKWFTGTATMRLVDEGKIDLAAPIQTYCPQYPEKEWEITTRHLLAHISGIRHYKDGEAENPSNVHYTDVLGPLNSFKDDPLGFEPGMGWQYSSHAYRVLGCVVAGASGQGYNKHMAEAIFAPSGMVLTADEDATNPASNAATGYELVRRKRLEPAPVRDISENLPAGGHISTASDIVRFSQAFDQGQLVSADGIALMSSNPIAKTGAEIEAGYGHGMDFMGAFGGAPGHGGRQEGATTLVVLFPERNLSVAVMTNARGWGNINELTGKVVEVYAEGTGR